MSFSVSFAIAFEDKTGGHRAYSHRGLVFTVFAVRRRNGFRRDAAAHPHLCGSGGGGLGRGRPAVELHRGARHSPPTRLGAGGGAASWAGPPPARAGPSGPRGGFTQPPARRG